MELITIGDHLAECNDCRYKLGVAEERAAILQSLTRDLQSAMVKSLEHLTYKQIAGYVDGNLDSVQMELVQSHLEICARCKAEWQDLAKYQKELKSEQSPKTSFLLPISFRNKFAAQLPRVI